MSTKKTKKGVGRPKREFTEEQIAQMEEYALDGCQNGTIANLMDIPIETLIRRFRKILTKKRCERYHNIRKAQTIKGVVHLDTGMLCFLGKNELGQTDKQEQIHGVTDDFKELLEKIASNGELNPPGER